MSLHRIVPFSNLATIDPLSRIESAIGNAWTRSSGTVFRLEEAADMTGLDEKTCAEHMEAFIQLGMLARTGDLDHPVRRQGGKLKVMTVTCLWDDARGIVGEPIIEEAKR